MAFKYEEAVPWGRSFDEYRRMFDLTAEDLGKSILGCADGPSSFNAELSTKGRRVISCDPLYQFTKDEIRARIDATYDTVIGQTGDNKEKFVWDVIPAIEDLGRVFPAGRQHDADCSLRDAVSVLDCVVPSWDRIGIGAAVVHRPLPHHRAYGSVHGGSRKV